MTKMYRCWLPDQDERFEDGFDIASTWEREVGRNIAEDAAERYHHRGGCESSWPVDVAIQPIDENGDPVGPSETYTVEREAIPNFTAIRKKENP